MEKIRRFMWEASIPMFLVSAIFLEFEVSNWFYIPLVISFSFGIDSLLTTK